MRSIRTFYEIATNGCKSKFINSKLCYIDFYYEEIHLQYVYNVNKKGNYFLERTKPYQLPIKDFKSENDIVEIIRVDVEQFKNAMRSHNSRIFIDVLKKFEDLYLY